MSELLFELVRRYSPSTREHEAVRYLTDWMTINGMIATVDAAGNACGTKGDDDAPNTLMLLGHIDTVQGEIPVRIEEGVLYGRGSVDAKGSLCAFAEATAQASVPQGWRVVVVGAVEEECATSKGARAVRDAHNPTLCIIGEPSGARRLTLGYKGRLLVDYTLSRPVAHTARPEATVGAIGAALWQDVLHWSETQNTGVERYFDQVMPSLRAINTTTDHFQETLTMTMGFRLPPRVSPEQTQAAVESFVAEGELKCYSAEYAYQGDKNNALVRGMLAAVRGQGGRPDFVLKTGTSDMNVVGVKWKCPIIAYGPGDSNLDHTPNEHLPLDEYQLAVTTLRHLIEHLPDSL
ncbi:MAG: [LysW]-lysine hydrolase [Anaerolineae bacterium]